MIINHLGFGIQIIIIEQIKELGHDVNVYISEFDMPSAEISVFISCTKLVSADGLKSNSNIAILQISRRRSSLL